MGQLAVMEPSTTVVTVTAYRDSEVLFLPARGFERIVADDPAAFRCFYGITADHVRTLLRLTAELLLLPTAARLAARLGLMCDDLPPSERPPVIEVTQADLAVMLGVSRQRLNTSLQTLARAGAIETRSRRIVVLDRDRLAALARRTDVVPVA
jgi:CRP-like cAMP-binding protein